MKVFEKFFETYQTGFFRRAQVNRNAKLKMQNTKSLFVKISA
jgi:hypothetical protein